MFAADHLVAIPFLILPAIFNARVVLPRSFAIRFSFTFTLANITFLGLAVALNAGTLAEPFYYFVIGTTEISTSKMLPTAYTLLALIVFIMIIYNNARKTSPHRFPNLIFWIVSVLGFCASLFIYFVIVLLGSI